MLADVEIAEMVESCQATRDLKPSGNDVDLHTATGATKLTTGSCFPGIHLQSGRPVDILSTS